MSLLSICQAACATAPVALPASIIGSTDETAILLLALANDAGDALARKRTGGWVSMIREYDFTTVALAPQTGSVINVGSEAQISGISTTGVSAFRWQATGTYIPNNAIITAVTASTVTLNQPASSTGTGTFTLGQSDYALPSDFQRPIDNTFWDRTRYWQMRGPQSPQEWQLYKSSQLGNATVERRFRFRSIRAFGDISPTVYLSIDPLPLDDGAQLVFEYVSNAWCESATGTPQSAWAADTDVGVLDEYLLRLSLKYRLLRKLGLSYAEELSEYESECDKAMATDGGAMTLNLTPRRNTYLLSPWNIPDTGYGGTPT
jgi:hypothetical protein